MTESGWVFLPPWITALLVSLLVIVGWILYTDLHLLLFRRHEQEGDRGFLRDMQAAKVPGAALLIIREGQIDSVSPYGLADPKTGQKISPDTLFTIASISKTVTATALTTLYEQGKFGLDEDINLYLPFSVRNPNFPDTPITFRMLLTHTSSIRDSQVYTRQYTLRQKPVLPDSPIPLGEHLADYLKPGGKWFHPKNNFLKQPPGTRYTYSNTGFGLVGFLTELISGMPFDEYCKKAVFIPLGMKHSAWHHRDVDINRMAVPYGYDNLRHKPKPIGFYGYPTYPDGALKTSVSEYARFLSIFANEGKTFEGKAFLKPETVKEMLSTHHYPGLSSGEKSVGLAWHRGKRFYQHTGGDPGIFTITLFDPVSRQGAVFFSNGADYNGPGLVRQLFFIKRVSSILKKKFES